ncbi:MAG: 50S ribosomal protein L10 [Acutalibacteraceae bacterium]
MPSAKVLEAKKQEVAELSERLSGSCAGVLVDYKGIAVTDDTVLRSELRKAGVKYTVTKNTMLRLAVKGTTLEGLDSVLEGTTAIATSENDYTAAAKILSKFADTHKIFTIKSGFIDGKIIDATVIKSLAKLPSRETLLSMVANVLSAPIASFARAVRAIADKNGTENTDTSKEAEETKSQKNPQTAEATAETAEN